VQSGPRESLLWLKPRPSPVKLLQQQIDRYLASHSQCPDCGATLKAKNYTNRSFRTLFGT
jgi:polyferredoxin